VRPPELQARRVRTIRRLADGGEPPRTAPLQRTILDALGTEPRTLHELTEEIGVEQGAVLAAGHRLVARGAAVLEWQTVERDPRAHRPTAIARDHDLATEQRAALAQVEALGAGGELLLEGVAAAGKTDVYLAALASVLGAGGSAIVLVPEVSLVTQLADRVASLVGEPLAVLHSGLSAGERHDTWWRILRGEARVVVGTRMAVFAPLADLRLIVVDEAHDGAYKADRTPRYDARWVASRRAALTGARVVMGTATPSVVTIARVRGGLVERARLVERRVGQTPSVEIVDLRAELAEGNRSIFSRPLAEALAGLQQGSEQAILLMNRRGAATFVLCRDCGESLRCPDCDLPFVFHLSGGQLRCHHCGRTARPPEKCPNCGSGRIRYFGAGTQRVEAELRARFPALRVSRLDSDALAARRGFEAIYDDFRDGRVDVLVGTQLAAKGLDLPSVTLAAVIAADVTLNLPDYLAPERTFQLLAQVAGRAGRGDRPGRVLIQTYAAGHYAIRAAGRLDIGGGCSATRRRASLPASSWRTPIDRGRRPAAARPPRLSPGAASRSMGRCRRTSRGAPAGGASRSSSVRGTRRCGRQRSSTSRRAWRSTSTPSRCSSVGTMRAMVNRPILTADEPILHERARKVTHFDASLHRLLEEMVVTMREAPGIGLAANQIGVPLQVAVIELEDKVTELINPEIVRTGGEVIDWEGCLSVPGFVAEVHRHAKVTVKARNRHGKEFRVKGEELFARALQHEIDHLNGVLYIDYLDSLEELVRVSDHPSEVEEPTTAGT
jgi:primosomal protein N'/peptide deformylase